MKATKSISSIIIIFLFCLFCVSCSSTSAVRKAVSDELDPLKKLDSDAAYTYLSQSGILDGIITESGDLSVEEIKNVVSLFFQKFDYEIQSVNVSEDGNTASVSVRLTTLDTQSLSKDYASLSLRDSITTAAKSGSTEYTPSTKERFLLLLHLLETGDYETVTSECTIELSKEHGKWTVNRSAELEDRLSGGLISQFSDSYILTPEETLDIYLNTILKMSVEDLGNYLGLTSLYSEADDSLREIYQAMIEQVHEHFDYEIQGSTINGSNAEVNTKITSFDSDSIMEACTREMDEYLATPDALIAGADARISHSRELLLKHIRENTAVRTSDTEFSMNNNGNSWVLKDPGNDLGKALFGTIQIDEES